MNEIIAIFYLFSIFLLTFLVLFLGVFWGFQIYYTIAKNRIVFVPTFSKKVLKEIKKYIQKAKINTKEYNLVELGCGTANVSNWLLKNFEFKKAIGVEIDFITYFTAKFFSAFRKSKIQFIRKDVLKYDVPKQSIIYLYLRSTIVTQLYIQNKFKESLVFSLTFPIRGIKPSKTVKLNNFYDKLYIYDFRSK
jgi:SAM-dependent methyltransferase